MGEGYTGFLYAASKDVQAIEALAQDDLGRHAEVIAFHAQQAAEKMVKAAFAAEGQMPSRTHDIDCLLEEAQERGWIALDEGAMEASSRLTIHAVNARYTMSPDIERGEALQAIQDANTVAAVLTRNGFDSIEIPIEAQLLRSAER